MQLTRLAHLPRDSRDTLFLLGVIALVVLPQVDHLPVWCSALTGLVLFWRGLLAWQSKPLPSRWWLLLVLVIALAATWLTHRTFFGRDAGVTLIVILLALKTLELRAQRDAYVVFFLSFFCMLSNFFFSQSLLTALSMLLALLGLLTALVNANMPVGKPPLLDAAKISARMVLLGTPVMLVLFMLFPRLAPLWGMPSDAARGKTGLNDQMRVGSIAKLAQDDSIAMRIKFDGKAPSGSDVYLRGPVLSAFDGREWLPNPNHELNKTNTIAPVHELHQLRVTGDAVNYEVTLEPQNKPWVFVLDAALTAPQLTNYALRLSPDLQWLASSPITELVRYKAQSHLTFTHGPTQAHAALLPYLALPTGSNPRTVQMAAEIKQNPNLASADTPTLVNAVMQRLRTGGYEYTLEPGLYGEHTADEFWFDNKTGFCEHIASSFVILMRAMNVPARVVTGYQGGELNALDGTWIVRQSDAHAWAEVWQINQIGTEGSWVRVDPTSAVAPQRIGIQQRLNPPTGAFGGAVNNALVNVWSTIGFNPFKHLRAGWDAVNNTWNQKVLNYTQNKQFELLKNLGFTSPSWEDLGYLISGLLVLLALLGSVWVQWDKRQHDPWLRLLQTVQSRLHKSGLSTPPNTPPRALAALVHTHFGDSGKHLSAWLIKLESVRYATQSASAASAQTTTMLKRELEYMTWPAKAKNN